MKNTMIIDETINWNKVENKMTASAATAPYLGAVQSKGTVMFADFVKGVKEDGCSESELEISRVMTKQGELLKSYVAQNYKVYTPYGIAGVHITKSFPAQDAPFNPTVNEAIMSILTNAETRNCLDGVTLKEDRAAAATLRGPKINSVCTGGTNFDVIDGTEPFVIAGTGLHLDNTKATDKVTLTNVKTGAVTEVTDYTCDGEGFRIDAQLVAAIPAGKYVLAVHVDEGTEDNPNVLSAEHKVDVTGSPVPPPPPVQPPEIGEIRTESTEDGTVKVEEDVVITGANLAGASVKIKYKTPPEEERQIYTCPTVVAEDGKITIPYESWRFVPDDLEADTTIEFIVETAGGSARRDGIEVDFDPPAP